MTREIPVPIAVNNRHIHLSEDHARKVFGESHRFSLDPSPDRFLWPGHTLWREKVTLAGPSAAIPRVSILGPWSEKTTVEMSCADAYHLGLVPHDVKAKKFLPGVTVIGPAGSIFVSTEYPVNGRWLCASKVQAEKHHLKNDTKVDVRVGVSPDWATTFHQVQVIVDGERDEWAFYLDPDAASAASVKTGETAHVLVGDEKSSVLRPQLQLPNPLP